MIDSEKYSIVYPARIVEFYEETQTADVLICVDKVFNDAKELQATGERLPIKGVPVHTPFGGGWSITFPIKPEDTCLIVFSQAGYDHWLFEDKNFAGTVSGRPNPWIKRKFNENDGFALVGFNTLPRAISDYTVDGSQWRNSDKAQNIHLKEDKTIEVNSDVKVTINAPEVVINCEKSIVNASSEANVTSPTTNIDGSSLNISASSSVSITSPSTSMSGNLSVQGAINGSGGMAISGGSGGSSVTGDLSISSGSVSVDGDVSSGGISLTGHTHIDSQGGGTSVPQ